MPHILVLPCCKISAMFLEHVPLCCKFSNVAAFLYMSCKKCINDRKPKQTITDRLQKVCKRQKNDVSDCLKKLQKVYGGETNSKLSSTRQNVHERQENDISDC